MSFFVNLAKANADNARLNTDNAALAGERDTLKAALAERDAAAESCRAQFDATVADLTEKLSLANAEVLTLTAAAQTAGQQAAEIVAAQGLPVADLPKMQAPSAATADDLAAKIRAEKDPAQRAALFAQLQSIWKSQN